MYPGLGGQYGQGGYGGQGGYSGEYPGQQARGYPGQQPPGGYNVPGQQPGQYPPGSAPGGYPGTQGGDRYGQMQSGGYQPNAVGGFGGHSNYPPQGGGGVGVGGGGANPEIMQWFNAVDTDRSGKINAKELQAALVNGQGKNFSDPACQMMISMFDHDKSGTIDVNEFQQLYTYINQWLSVFRTYDRDQSGHIEESELSQALQQMGFQFSPQFVSFLVTKSDMETHKQISVDQFIVLCVQIQRFTEAFRSRDAEKSGIITIAFEDFLGIALSCSI